MLKSDEKARCKDSSWPNGLSVCADEVRPFREETVARG